MTLIEKKAKAFDILKKGYLKDVDDKDDETFFHLSSWIWINGSDKYEDKYYVIANYADYNNDMMEVSKEDYEFLEEILNEKD